jgi:uracil-DNA glycosylase family 4
MQLRFDKRYDPLISEIAEKIEVCTKCDLAEGRINAVPGEGPQHAEIFFIGEAPGAKEDETGRPFVGQSGKLMTEQMGKVGLKREDCFITSIVKCRPPDNRKPKKEEIKSCVPYLLSQIDSISPKVVVTMGNTAYDVFSHTFYLPKKKVGDVRGQVYRLHSTSARYLIPTYHPAGVIYNRKLIPFFKEDIKKAREYAQNRD